MVGGVVSCFRGVIKMDGASLGVGGKVGASKVYSEFCPMSDEGHSIVFAEVVGVYAAE